VHVTVPSGPGQCDDECEEGYCRHASLEPGHTSPFDEPPRRSGSPQPPVGILRAPSPVPNGGPPAPCPHPHRRERPRTSSEWRRPTRKPIWQSAAPGRRPTTTEGVIRAKSRGSAMFTPFKARAEAYERAKMARREELERWQAARQQQGGGEAPEEDGHSLAGDDSVRSGQLIWSSASRTEGGQRWLSPHLERAGSAGRPRTASGGPVRAPAVVSLVITGGRNPVSSGLAGPRRVEPRPHTHGHS
jgi:hypothetical protein